MGSASPMADNKAHNEVVDEMSIVDILTKLIFDAESELTALDKTIVDLLPFLDTLLIGASRRDISEYLRSMAIDEMIVLVQSIKTSLDKGYPAEMSSKGFSQHKHTVRP